MASASDINIFPGSASVSLDPVNPIHEVRNIAKLTEDELVTLLAKRVIYSADDLVALDKPMLIPYSGSKATRLQVDRVLQRLKKLIAPDVDRLYLIESLDRCASGVLLFAKNADRQKQLKEQIEDGRVQHRFRCIVRGLPEEPNARITIPLRKIVNERDIRWLPAYEAKGELSHGKTLYNVVNENRSLHVSLLDVVVDRVNVHQIRSHLGYGIGCPLIGEAKYNNKQRQNPIPLPPQTLRALGFDFKQLKNLPMFIHHAETLVPLGNGSRFSVVKAPYSKVFTYATKVLGLAKK